MLKEELKESNLRLKAVKQGHNLTEVAQPFDTSFYLPKKDLYTIKAPEVKGALHQKSRQVSMHS